MNITKQQFEAYEKVRKSGKYNMITQINDVSKEGKIITPQEVNYITDYYVELKAKFK